MKENCVQNTGAAAQSMAEMKSVDVRTVDGKTLVDIATVTMDDTLSREERIRDYIRQVKNPYCYLSNGMIVKVSFAGKRNIEECLKNAMFGTN